MIVLSSVMLYAQEKQEKSEGIEMIEKLDATEQRLRKRTHYSHCPFSRR